MSTIIKTKFGSANINRRGYYVIISKKEGNFNKLLHRLIFEDFHKIKLDEGIDIHHIDGDKTNNSINNLQSIKHEEHSKHHKIPLDSKLEMSKKRTSTGYFRVCKHKNKKCKNGFTWDYNYFDKNGMRKNISSVDFDKLKEKVLAKGLEWREF